MRLAVVALIALFLAACSDSAPVAPAATTESAAVVAKNCADPHWKDKNLGLWYSVCRQPLDW
jgi:PBP1b-binding outer membrane lipoprotein LpoB